MNRGFDHKTIERMELAWLGIGVVLVVMLFAGVLASMISDTVPNIWSGGGLTRVDVKALDKTPFAQPGVREVNGKLEAYILARSFMFQPAELRVPVNTPVTLHITAADVQHSLAIPTTNINVQIIPGQVAAATHTFKKVGTFVTACGEYCGVGHEKMQFKLTVYDDKTGARQ